MMNRIQATLLALGLAAASSVRAVTLYDQPFDGSGNLYASQNDTGGGNGNFATVYDDFTLGSSATIGTVSWTGGYFNGSPSTITGFAIKFWADSAGQPGALLASDTIAGTASEVSLGSFGGFPIYTYSASVSAFSAVGGTTYWMSIVPDVGYPPQWGWATGTGGNGSSYQDFFGGRSRLGADMAFKLEGSTASVPDVGATGLLLGFALTGMTLLRRKL